MTHDPSHSHDRKPDAGHAAPSGEELTCREICDFVMAYLDGELSGNERTVFEAHLRLCPQCVSYLDGYKSTIKLAKQSQAADPCAPLPPVPEGLVQAILAARKK